MSKHRFFVLPEAFSGSKIAITGEDVKHIRNVLRLKPKDEIIVCDGEGLECKACLEEVKKDLVTASILSCEKKKPPSIEIALFQAIPKAQKMDFIIQKTTEIGVAQIFPLFTERTVSRFKTKKVKEKVLRLQKIALEAAKQSQRVTVPKIYEPLTLTESLEFLKLYDLVLVFWEEEKKNTLKETIKNLTPKKIAVVIGPEGGLSSEEIEILKSAQGKPVTLGKRALRVETASIISLALLSYELGALD